MTRPGSGPSEGERQLPPLLSEFRTALREEIDAARRASSSAAVELISGRRIEQRGASFQYVFLVETPLNLPDDSPADLQVPALRQTVEATIVSVEGLSLTISVPVDLGSFVARARLQSDLTHLMRRLIERIESLADEPNAAGSGPLAEDVRERLDGPAEFDTSRLSGRGYYVGLCFKVYAGDVELADGGFTEWTQALLGDRKERLLISGLGTERALSLQVDHAEGN